MFTHLDPDTMVDIITILKNRKFQFNSNAGQKPAEGWFLSKWVYNFWPAKILCTYQDIIHSNIT